MNQPFRRHTNSRSNMMEGLMLQGLNSTMGKVAVGMLLLLGSWLLVGKKQLDANKLTKVEATVKSKPYQPGMDSSVQKNLVLIPVEENSKLLVVENFALKAIGADSLIRSLQTGDKITVWLDDVNAGHFANRGGGGRVQISLLSKTNTYIIDDAGYNRALGNNGQMGWWVIALGLSMVPYYFISRPRIHPGWVFTIIVAAMLTWLVLGNG